MFVHRIGELRDEFPAREGGEVVGVYICRVCHRRISSRHMRFSRLGWVNGAVG